MGAAESLAIVAAGVFFLNGLLTGVWKYLQIRSSESATAHPYVDIAHRASLLYSFAAILLAKFAEISQLPDTVEFFAVLFPLVFFGGAIVLYMLHGYFQDTDNQLRPPFTMGKRRMPAWVVATQMWALVVAEIGGFVVLFYGVLKAVL
jgi:hypothetical protein